MLEASELGDGTIQIEGHDLGPGVAAFWGSGLTEYEWGLDDPPGRRPAGARNARRIAGRCRARRASGLVRWPRSRSRSGAEGGWSDR